MHRPIYAVYLDYLQEFCSLPFNILYASGDIQGCPGQGAHPPNLVFLYSLHVVANAFMTIVNESASA